MSDDVEILDITETMEETPAAERVIVWIGGPITAGGGAGSDADRMSTLASGMLGLTEKNYASVTAKVSDGLVTCCHAARDDTSYNHADVAYVVLAGGLEDPVSALADVMAKSREAVTGCRQAFPAARIVWAASPGSLASMSDEQITGSATVTAAIIGQAHATDSLAINLRTVLGSDPDLQAVGILPNAAGHELLAEAIVTALIADRGEPIDTPVTSLVRRYGVSGDWLGRQVQTTQRREAEKREANRPTGTELGGVTQKLDELTQQQGVQQVLLELQQAMLKQQQEELKKQQDELDEHQQELESHQRELEQQQQKLQSQQNQLTKHQNELEAQQKALKAAQDAIAEAQKQLGLQQEQLKGQQDQLNEAQQELNNKISAYLNEYLLPELNRRFGLIDGRLDALESGLNA